jgi:amine acid ABC transporter, permease protein, 3-TM region, His/Glu/Gln/Arg/opine family
MKKMVKRMMTLIPTILLVLGLLLTSGCQSTSTTKLDEIKKAGKIILGTSADYPPYEFIKMQDGKEQYVGFDIDVAQGIADKIGVELEINNMNFDGLLPALQTGTVDFVLAGMQATDERKEAVDFSTPYNVEKNVVLVKAENANKYTTIADLAGKKVGAQLGTTQETAANMVEGAELLILQNLLDLVQQVKTGVIDALIISDMSGGSHIAADPTLAFATSIEVPYEQEGTAVAIAKNNPELLAEIQAALDEMIANNEITKFIADAQKLALQADENGVIQGEIDLSKYDLATGKLGEIVTSGQIIMGTSAGYPPFESIEIIDGKETYVGFDINIAQELATRLGVELVIDNMEFADLLPTLQAGKVDFAIAGIQPTDESRQSVDFTDPYFIDTNVLLTTTANVDKYQSVADLNGKKIAVQQSTMQEKAAQEIKGAEVVSIPKLLDAVAMVENGTVDAMVIVRTNANAQIKEGKDFAIAEKVEIHDNLEGYAVATQKGNEDLLTYLDDQLKDMKDSGMIQALYSKATGEETEETTVIPTQRKTFDFIFTYYPLLITGIKNTLLVALFSVAIGSVGGILLAILKLSKNKILSTIATMYIDFIRGTPLLIQLYMVAFGLPTLGIRLPALLCGVIALSLNCFAYIAEIIRAGINAVDKGQMEAARSIGMSENLAMKEIILPQAIKNILPALGNEFITVIKESSIVSVTGVMELMFAANTIRGNTFQAFAPLIVTSIIYFAITFIISKILTLLEGKLDTDAN